MFAIVAREAAQRGFRLVEWRARTLAADALVHTGSQREAERELAAVAAEADAARRSSSAICASDRGGAPGRCGTRSR